MDEGQLNGIPIDVCVKKLMVLKIVKNKLSLQIMKNTYGI